MHDPQRGAMAVFFPCVATIYCKLENGSQIKPPSPVLEKCWHSHRTSYDFVVISKYISFHINVVNLLDILSATVKLIQNLRKQLRNTQVNT